MAEVRGRVQAGEEPVLWGISTDSPVPRTGMSVLLLDAKDILTSLCPILRIGPSFPQLYAMTLSLPFSPGSSVNMSSAMEGTYQSFDSQG
jgi:hypothetical protein